jgi:hypothetical protein
MIWLLIRQSLARINRLVAALIYAHFESDIAGEGAWSWDRSFLLTGIWVSGFGSGFHIFLEGLLETDFCCLGHVPLIRRNIMTTKLRGTAVGHYHGFPLDTALERLLWRNVETPSSSNAPVLRRASPFHVPSSCLFVKSTCTSGLTEWYLRYHLILVPTYRSC